MKLKVYIERQKKQVMLDVKEGTTIKNMLKKLNLNPVAVVTTISNEVVTEDYKIQAKDKVSVHSVVSGG